MKFLDTVSKKLQLLGEQGPDMQQPQAPGSVEPADATAPQAQQAPTPEEIDQQGKDEQGDRDADKELCLQIVKNLLEKVKEKIRSMGGEEGQRSGDILDRLYIQIERREGDLNSMLNSVLNTIQNEL